MPRPWLAQNQALARASAAATHPPSRSGDAIRRTPGKQIREEEGTSLGIVRPGEIHRCYLRRKPASERIEWERKRDSITQQTELPFDRPVMRLAFIDVEFHVKFHCNDPRCSGHDMELHHWEVHELYRKLQAEGDPEIERKVREKMEQFLDLDRYDVFMFFGTFRDHMRTFGLMGSYSCPKTAIAAPIQGSLFA